MQCKAWTACACVLCCLPALALLPLAGLVYHNAVTKRQEAAALATSDVLGLVLTCENDEELNVESAEIPWI